MKKFLSRYPGLLMVLFSLLTVFFGFIAIVCFQMFEQYRPEVILDEHLATFALPVGILFLYFFIRGLSSCVDILVNQLSKKFNFKRTRH